MPQAEGLIKTFLDATKSSLGSSKSLVDISGEGADVISFLTHLHQVGPDRGHAPARQGPGHLLPRRGTPRGGLAVHHERRAVNLDAACGWAQGKADVLYVADAFAVMAKVNELLG